MKRKIKRMPMVSDCTNGDAAFKETKVAVLPSSGENARNHGEEMNRAQNKERYKSKAREKAKKVVQFLANPRLLLCIAIAWMITNGWSYVLLGLGHHLNIHWMVAVAGTYIAFLWLPVSPEKIVTFAIAIGLLRLFFPSDQKTLDVLKKLYGSAKDLIKKKKEYRAKKQQDESHP